MPRSRSSSRSNTTTPTASSRLAPSDSDAICSANARRSNATIRYTSWRCAAGAACAISSWVAAHAGPDRTTACSRACRLATFTTSGAVRANNCQRCTSAPSAQKLSITASQSSSRMPCSATPSSSIADPNVSSAAQATFSRSFTITPTVERPSGVGTAIGAEVHQVTGQIHPQRQRRRGEHRTPEHAAAGHPVAHRRQHRQQIRGQRAAADPRERESRSAPPPPRPARPATTTTPGSAGNRPTATPTRGEERQVDHPEPADDPRRRPRRIHELPRRRRRHCCPSTAPICRTSCRLRPAASAARRSRGVARGTPAGLRPRAAGPTARARPLRSRHRQPTRRSRRTGRPDAGAAAAGAALRRPACAGHSTSPRQRRGGHRRRDTAAVG